MQTGSPTRRDRTSSCSTRSSNNRRLGSPVRASCQAMCETFSRSSRFWTAVAAWSASPDSRSWRSGSWIEAVGASPPKLAAMTPRNSPAANSGATTEAAVPDRCSRFWRYGSSVVRVEDHHLPVEHHPFDDRRVGADGERIARAGLGPGGLGIGWWRPLACSRSPVGGPDGDDRTVVGVWVLEAGGAGPRDHLTGAAVPQVHRGLVAVGHGRHGVGQQLDQLGQGGHPREGLGEREEGPGGGVAPLGLGEHAEDVECGGCVLGVEVEHPGLPRGGARAGWRELDQPAVAPPGGGDVHRQAGAVTLSGRDAPEIGGQPLGLPGVEAPVVQLDRHARNGPGPSGGTGAPRRQRRRVPRSGRGGSRHRRRAARARWRRPLPPARSSGRAAPAVPTPDSPAWS